MRGLLDAGLLLSAVDTARRVTGPRVLLNREARENGTRAAGVVTARVAAAVVDIAEVVAAVRTAGAQPTVGVSTDERGVVRGRAVCCDSGVLEPCQLLALVVHPRMVSRAEPTLGDHPSVNILAVHL